jgi:tetratricopeptide (TPR) repeat protein
MDPRQTERFHDAIQRMIAGKNFRSPDELNSFLQEQLGGGALEWDALGPGTAASPLEQAQELFYQALDAPSRSKRVKMTRQALSICEDCADAWLLLAQEEAKTMAERELYIRRGLEAAERTLGEKAFEEYRGAFWGFHETRPYMRARAEIAALLEETGRTAEAIEHWEAMLELNPNDNQGIRTRLLRVYLEGGAQEKAAALFERFPDDASCEMAYGRVIHDLATSMQAAARKSLQEALKIIRHVPDFLLGRRSIPRRRPEMITWGGEDEAGLYALDHLKLWRNTAGARELLSAAK